MDTYHHALLLCSVVHPVELCTDVRIFGLTRVTNHSILFSGDVHGGILTCTQNGTPGALKGVSPIGIFKEQAGVAQFGRASAFQLPKAHKPLFAAFGIGNNLPLLRICYTSEHIADSLHRMSVTVHVYPGSRCIDTPIPSRRLPKPAEGSNCPAHGDGAGWEHFSKSRVTLTVNSYE